VVGGAVVKRAYTTQAQVRAAFWDAHPKALRTFSVPTKGGRRRVARQNDQPADTRVAFVGFIDHLDRSGQISTQLAACVTL